ncbi:Ribonuclease UK114 [Sciurus carolinensis]|uniref:Ribonuclease UK114 n=1 Tax=Sciurus carolinensis TaxID=30640 RepID=A0AA41N3B7_SCICA|nr:Ribonuclease UK114 [Sciurus carolinensis]
MLSLIKTMINTLKAPGFIGSDSQAMLVNRTIYISGQKSLDTLSGQGVPGGVAAEAKQALTSVGEILKAADSDFTNVVKVVVLLAHMNDLNLSMKSANSISRVIFLLDVPTRLLALPKGDCVEIEAVAVQEVLMTA